MDDESVPTPARRPVAASGDDARPVNTMDGQTE
jgi:hypothetical protein